MFKIFKGFYRESSFNGWGSTILTSFFILMMIFFGVIFRKSVVYVPFVLPQTDVYDFGEKSLNRRDIQLVTLSDYQPHLARKFPDLISIESLDQLSNNQIILLPWNQTTNDLRHLPIQGVSFFESALGTIQVKQFQMTSDQYQHFLEKRVKLTAAGTVVLARGVARVIDRHQDSLFPWRGTNYLFKQSDINIINFKSPLIEKYKVPKSRWLLMGKSSYVSGLVESNIDLVGISGNHMGDAGMDGLLETIKILNNQGILTVGAGQAKDQAYDCKKITKKDLVFGFLAFNNVGGSVGKADQGPGIAWLDQDALLTVKTCSSMVDHLIVMVNWGIEYVHKPRKKEMRWAQLLVEYGANIVIGDQAHWVQNHEKIGDAHVSYGLGNYIFDQHWSENTTEGIIQQYVFYNNRLMAVNTIPIKLQKNGGVDVIAPMSDRYRYVMKAYGL